MIDTIKKGDSEIYRCEECGLFYAKKAQAESCQAWCSEHKSCNLEIIKDAIKTDA